MAEIELPVIITAIANSDLEGFVAGTLYSQGWSVIYRALDAQALTDFIKNNQQESKSAIVIFAPDLADITPELIDAVRGRVRQVIGLTNDSKSDIHFTSLSPVPHDGVELISLIRGYVRAPMIRATSAVGTLKRRARVIALGSASSASGCTTIAINLAMELSVLGHEVLLLDADVRRPSIAALLELRNLNDTLPWQMIAAHLSAGEFTKEKLGSLNENLDRAMSEFDFIIIDLGLIEEIADSLTDRRWTASVIHWSCDSADEIWFIGKADVLGNLRFSSFIRNFSQVSIRAKVGVLLNMKTPSRRAPELETTFLASSAALHPKRVLTLPRDARAVSKAQSEHATLIEMDDRSTLRKGIAKIALEVVG